MRSAATVAVASLLLLLPAARALIIATGSPCAEECGNVLDSTSPEEIVCEQNEYTTTDAGDIFVNCLSCLSTSVYAADGNETDAQWMLCVFSPLSKLDSVM